MAIPFIGFAAFVYILLVLTLYAWSRLVEPLEKFGWAVGIVLALVELVTWVVGDIGFQYRLVIGALAFIVLGATAVWSRHMKAEIERPTQLEAPTRIPELDRTFFRNQLFNELVSILNQLRSPIIVVAVISYSVWSSKPDYVKIQLLGTDDHSKLDAFYRRVDERNMFYANAVIDKFLDEYDDKSRREIIETVKRLFDEIAWLSVRKDEVNWPTE